MCIQISICMLFVCAKVFYFVMYHDWHWSSANLVSMIMIMALECKRKEPKKRREKKKDRDWHRRLQTWKPTNKSKTATATTTAATIISKRSQPPMNHEQQWSDGSLPDVPRSSRENVFSPILFFFYRCAFFVGWMAHSTFIRPYWTCDRPTDRSKNGKLWFEAK